MDDQEKVTPFETQPSADATPALFASARKKQLEQQEKEAQRQAAEAEVRRLELEVEERRRRAEAAVKLPEKELRRAAKEKARASRKKLGKGAKIAIIVAGVIAAFLLLFLIVYLAPFDITGTYYLDGDPNGTMLVIYDDTLCYYYADGTSEQFEYETGSAWLNAWGYRDGVKVEFTLSLVLGGGGERVEDDYGNIYIKAEDGP